MLGFIEIMDIKKINLLTLRETIDEKEVSSNGNDFLYGHTGYG